MDLSGTPEIAVVCSMFLSGLDSGGSLGTLLVLGTTLPSDVLSPDSNSIVS